MFAVRFGGKALQQTMQATALVSGKILLTTGAVAAAHVLLPVAAVGAGIAVIAKIAEKADENKKK